MLQAMQGMQVGSESQGPAGEGGDDTAAFYNKMRTRQLWELPAARVSLVAGDGLLPQQTATFFTALSALCSTDLYPSEFTAIIYSNNYLEVSA